ncbi:hypothetical protein GALMADRAFT_708493 [Galerina marginata CBS 339.88]|uniref:Uncharacterized protein n=1 Tax=Galerina marginata (strain CBS 339.88) TaxID=685588 RepID=A0A067TZ40_GALM3|nr:hypothetical protein GALMADRAFT_708493 [Galerina marginata CBS 339.88]
MQPFPFLFWCCFGVLKWLFFSYTAAWLILLLVQSTSSVPVGLARSLSMSTSMSTWSLAPGSTSRIAGNLRPPESESFTDQPQYHGPPMDAYPSNSGLQTQELRSQLRHYQHADRPQFSARNINQLAVRFSENVDGEPIVDYESTHSVSSTRLISVFGNLGQVDQATLLEARVLSRRTAAGLSPEAHHDAGTWTEMDTDESGPPYTPSESFSDPFSSASIGHQRLPSPETGKRRRDAEEPPQHVQLGTDTLRVRQQFDDPRFELQTLHERNAPARVSAGRAGQRERRFSLGDEEFQGRLFAPSSWKGFDSPNVVNQKADDDSERGSGTGQRKRRGSDGGLFQHSGDRGGVDVEMLHLPSEVPIKIPGRWSFDTTALARDGILHGLGIGGLSHTPTSHTPQSQNVDTIAREF